MEIRRTGIDIGLHWTHFSNREAQIRFEIVVAVVYASIGESSTMISQIGIERSAEISHLKRRLCKGATRQEMPLKAAASSRPETWVYMSCGSEDVTSADAGAA